MTARITCTRRLEFDAAHRVLRHESKCKYMHGHRYVVEATFAVDTLDSLGRVIDFGIIKEKLGTWIDTNWDHNTLLWDEDKALGQAVANITAQDVFYFPYNPTAENIAGYLLEKVCPKLFDGTGVECVSIKVNETPNCSAEATV